LAWTKSVDYLGTVRGRFGFLVIPTLLVYGTGGLAYGEINASTGVTESLGFVDTPGTFWHFREHDQRACWLDRRRRSRMVFWPIGASRSNISIYDLGNVTYHTPRSASNRQQILLERWSPTPRAPRTRFNGSVVRAGINYHFQLV